jgi:hypothetical protein
MKKAIKYIIIFFALLIVVEGAYGLTVIFLKYTALNKESKAYIENIAPKILANLSRETLFEYADDALTGRSQRGLDKTFKEFEKLGKFKQYRESNGRVRLNTDFFRHPLAVYYSRAAYQNGSALGEFSITKTNNQWRISAFSLNSTVISNP